MTSSQSTLESTQPGAPTGLAEPVITVRGLVKRHGRREVIKGLDMEVYPGEIVAFVGPNGAGKTTTVEILEGFRTPTDGEVRVLGVDPATAGAAWRDRVGIVLQESEPEPELTVRECVALYAGYYGTPRDIDDTIGLVGLGEQKHAISRQLSGGQRRRLDVALALIGDPAVVFLDEPTTGFDPSARRTAWGVIAGLRTLGKTVFLTTHYLDEAEQLADRIIVLADGRIVADSTPEALGGRDRMTATVRFTLPRRFAVRDLPAQLRPLAEADGHTVRLHSESPLAHVRLLADWAFARGVDLPDLDVRRPTLEDVYLGLTNPAEQDAT
jgi:ABC-2 type transport system ATP-binding protein